MEFTDTLKKNYEFRRLYNKGKSAVTPYLVVYARRTGRPGNRLGVTVSNKVGKAVVRNRVRRRLREIYRLHEGALCRGTDLVIVARNRSVNAEYTQLEKAYLRPASNWGFCAKRQRMQYDANFFVFDPFLPKKYFPVHTAYLQVYPHLFPVCVGGH